MANSVIPDSEASQAKRDNFLRLRGAAYPEFHDRVQVDFRQLAYLVQDVRNVCIDEIYQAISEIAAGFDLNDVAQALRDGRMSALEVSDRLDEIEANVAKSIRKIFSLCESSEMPINLALQLIRYGLTHDVPLSEYLPPSESQQTSDPGLAGPSK